MNETVGPVTGRTTSAPSGAASADSGPRQGATGVVSLLRRAARGLLATGLLLGVLAAPALAETRTLDLYYTHTKERLKVTYKKDGRYIPSALAELNRFLRDWRRNESTKMDPRLFDVVWETYQRSGSKKPIHIVSAYRSLATNNSLRSRSSGVAKNSQHTLGRAMDWYVPDVSVNRLREIAMKLQQGGVGWYPTSRSPFVHTDVGSVRAWPRMTRQQLVKLFPDGRTVHLPSDGKPLAGYQQALAEVKRNGGKAPIATESDSETRGGSGKGLLAMLFGGDDEEAADDEAYVTTGQTVKAAPPKREPTQTVPVATKPEPAAPLREEPVAPAAAPVVVAMIPKPIPAPARPQPVEAPAEPAAASTEVLPIIIANAPRPPTRPDLPVAEPVAATAVASVEVPLVPPARPTVEAPAEAAVPALALAAATPLPTTPAVPAPPAAAVAAVPLPVLAASAAPAPTATAAAETTGVPPSLATLPPASEPANAQLALAEVARDPIGSVPETPLLGYANPAVNAPAPGRPGAPRAAAVRVPPAPAQGFITGQPGPSMAAVSEPVDKADPEIGLSYGDTTVELPMFDGGQSAYWGIFARLIHPDQSDFGNLMVEPSRVVVTAFGGRAYPDLVSTRFQGAALPTLRVQRFEPGRDLAMR